MIQRVLLVSQFSNQFGGYCYADSFFRLLSKEDGIKVDFINTKNYTHDISEFLGDLIFNICFLITILSTKVEVLFLIKAKNLNYRLIKLAKKLHNCKVKNFYPDYPFCFYNGHSNSNILLAAELYDEFFIWTDKIIEPLKKSGFKNITVVPFFVDLELFSQKNNLCFEQSIDICFVGHCDEKRELVINHIAKHFPNICITVAGNGWRASKFNNVTLLPDQSVEEMITLFRKSKICLNIFKVQNEESINMRLFEIAATKSLMLCQASSEAKFYFTKNVAAIYFENLDDVCKKIDMLLNDKKIRNQVAQKSYEFVQQFDLRNFIPLLQKK